MFKSYPFFLIFKDHTDLHTSHLPYRIVSVLIWANIIKKHGAHFPVIHSSCGYQSEDLFVVEIFSHIRQDLEKSEVSLRTVFFEIRHVIFSQEKWMGPCSVCRARSARSLLSLNLFSFQWKLKIILSNLGYMKALGLSHTCLGLIT